MNLVPYTHEQEEYAKHPWTVFYCKDHVKVTHISGGMIKLYNDGRIEVKKKESHPK